jgi:oligosaccharide repeat unit polymerase
MTAERFVAGAVAIGLFAALTVLVRRRRRAGQRANDPATVFMAIWGGGLLLYAVPVIDYVSTPATAWFVVYGSIATFLAGAWLAQRRGGGGSGAPADEHERLSTVRVNLAWVGAGALSLLGFVFFLHGIDVTVGWQTLFQSPGTARAAQDLPEFQDAYGPGKALSYLAPVSLLLWTVAFRDRHFKGNWRFVAPAIIFVLLPYFFIGERLSLLFAVVWIVAFHFVWRPVGNPRRIALGATVLIVAGLSFFYVIGNQKGSTLDTYPTVREAVTSSVFEPVALPYMYATANVPVFGQLTQDPLAPTSYGQLTARPASTLAHRILPLSGSPPEQGGFYGVPFSSYNSATWLDPFYRDFGVLGALVLPGLFGFLATWIFLIARRRRTLVSSWLAAIGLAFVVFSPLKSLAPDALTWELLALAPLAGLFISPDARARLRSFTGGLQGRLSLDTRVITAIVAAAALTVAGLALFALQQGSSETRPTALTSGKLQADATKLVDSYDTISPTSDGPEGDTQSVTSRLGVSDTATRYEAMPDRTAAPAAPGAIGVYADGGAFSLRTLTDEGRVRVVKVVEGKDGFEVLAPKTEPDPGGTPGPGTSRQRHLTPTASATRSDFEPKAPGLPAVALVIVFLLTAVWSLVRLPPLHPLQLWSIPWSIASLCFALGLLPFIEISWLAAGLILGATAALGLGVAGGERLYSRNAREPAPGDADALQALLRPAALMAIGLTAIFLLAFLIQLSLRFGLEDALITNSDLRRAIGEGDFPITVKYIYANLAALALTGAMAGLASRTRVSKGWIATLLLLIATNYFTTARSNIFLAVVVAGVAFFIFRQRWPGWRSMTIGISVMVASSLILFVALGSLVGKEVDAFPEFQKVPNFFQDQGAISELAIPYRYLSSSIPAFELQVQQSSLTGQTYGCAMLTEACVALETTGLDVDPVPRVKAFTAPYFEWNTYTALDLPLIDFGKLFLVPIFALIGVLVGLSWAAARRLRAAGGVVYALFAACLVGGYSTFFFTSPHMVGAGLIALGCLAIASFRRRLIDGEKGEVVDPEDALQIRTRVGGKDRDFG